MTTYLFDQSKRDDAIGRFAVDKACDVRSGIGSAHAWLLLKNGRVMDIAISYERASEWKGVGLSVKPLVEAPTYTANYYADLLHSFFDSPAAAKLRARQVGTATGITGDTPEHPLPPRDA